MTVFACKRFCAYFTPDLEEVIFFTGESNIMDRGLKAKVYFTFYAYTRDSVKCTLCKFHHQNSTVRAPPDFFNRAGRTCAFNSLAIISFSARWQACCGGIDSQGSRRKTA